MKKLLILILISLALNNSQAASAGGVDYDSTNLYNKKSLKLTVIPVDYNQSTQKWSYKISWNRQTKKGGSFLIKNIVYVADASGKGEVQTDFNFKVKSKYSVVYYSKNNKKGTVVFRKSFKTLPTPNSVASAPISNCKVYTYQDKYNYNIGKHCLDNILLKGVYFVPKDQTTGIKSYWSTSVFDIFSQIKSFYESQFDNKIQIIVDTPVLIYGDKNIEEYNMWIIMQEIKKKIILPKTDAFIVRMIYPVQGEGGKQQQGIFGSMEEGNGSSVSNSWFWLDPENLGTIITKYGTNYSGYLGSAHEFGHSIGLSHPWEEESNRDIKGNILDPEFGNNELGSIMSYGGQKGPLITDSFIRDNVKNKMIVK